MHVSLEKLLPQTASLRVKKQHCAVWLTWELSVGHHSGSVTGELFLNLLKLNKYQPLSCESGVDAVVY